MAEPWKRETLMTLPVSQGERRVIRMAATCRGMTVTALLRAQLVDLER